MNITPKLTVFFLLLTICFASACSLSAPIIGDVSPYAVYERQADGRVATMLSVFFTYEDDDGVRDFSRMEVYCEKTGYTWVIDEDTVLVNTADAVTWVGYSRLLPPAGQPLAAGAYTVTVYDHAENIDAVSFELSDSDVTFADSIAAGTVEIPAELTVDYEKGTWETTSDWNKRHFVFFDDELVPVGFFNTGSRQGQLSSLRAKSENAETARFYVVRDNSNIVYSVSIFDLKK